MTGHLTDDLLRKFVASISEERRHQIMTDYVKYEQTGRTGDSELRRTAQEFLDRIGHASRVTGAWMKEITFEVYRYYAVRSVP
jgi:hypothetical protein